MTDSDRSSHSSQSPTPRSLGYRMPAEWEPHQATWLSWPHNRESWPGKFERILPAYARMVVLLARSETVHINVRNAGMQAEAQQLINEAGGGADIRFHHFATNDAWCRDHGAIFVTRTDSADEESPSALAAVDWEYNAWGGKYPPFDLDNQIPARMAEVLDVPRFEAGMVLEGGSIDVNGSGLLLTTEACLLNPNRNPHLNCEQIEARLRDLLSIDQVLWLKDGIVGDDTDGHIDDVTRFVSRNAVLTAVESDPADANFEPLQQNLLRLREMAGRGGEPLDIVELPMPPAVVYQGQRLPASYANFYIANTLVLVPTFNHDRDRQAIEILQSLFPTREVIGLDCTDLVWGLGAVHCLTQQVPFESAQPIKSNRAGA